MSESKSGSFEEALAQKQAEILDRVLPMEVYYNGLTLSRGTFSVKLGEIARWTLEYLAKGGEEFKRIKIETNHKMSCYDLIDLVTNEYCHEEINMEMIDIRALAASNARNVILEQRVSELEKNLSDMDGIYENLGTACEELRSDISHLQAANTQLTAALALAIERFGEMGTGLDTRTEHKMPELDPEETYLSGYKDLRSMSEHAYQIRDEIKKIWNPNEPR